MAITQVISTPPTAPNRATMADAVYSPSADAMMAYLVTLTTQQNLWATQANALAAAMNAVAAGAAYSIAYTFDTTTTDSDPGNGKLRLDNATQGSAATVRMDLLDQAGTDWSAAIDQFDGSTSTVKGYLTLRKLSDGTKWILFSVSARAAPSGYRNISVAVVAISGSNPFANGDTIVAEFSRTGDKGNTGAAAWIAPAAWVTTTAYVAGPPASVVTFSGETYVCLISHTAGVFATDLAAGKWIKVAQKGVDGAAPSSLTNYGDGSDGTVTVSGAVTLSRDMYYSNLTISAGAALNTNGWRIFVQNTLDLSAAPANSIFNSGGSGSAGAGSAAGGSGATAPGNSVGAGGAAGASGAGATFGGSSGSAGSAGNNGAAGGAGGASANAAGGAAGSGAAGGTVTPTVLHRPAPWLAPDGSSTLLKGGAGGGGAGGGAGVGDGSGTGRGGGGPGAGGGVVFIAARIINRGASTAAAAIQAKGGDGGAGGSGSNGGGGGGPGGGGGWVYILCDSLTGATATNAVDVSGGSGGAGGTGASTIGADGGGTGGGGRFTLGVLGTSTYTDTLSGVAAAAGNAHSGTTPGASKSVTAAQFSL